jgi:hypothetical protein
MRPGVAVRSFLLRVRQVPFMIALPSLVRLGMREKDYPGVEYVLCSSGLGV